MLVVFLAATVLRDLLVKLVRVGDEVVRDPVALVAGLVLAEVEAAAVCQNWSSASERSNTTSSTDGHVMK